MLFYLFFIFSGKKLRPQSTKKLLRLFLFSNIGVKYGIWLFDSSWDFKLGFTSLCCQVDIQESVPLHPFTIQWGFSYLIEGFTIQITNSFYNCVHQYLFYTHNGVKPCNIYILFNLTFLILLIVKNVKFRL